MRVPLVCLSPAGGLWVLILEGSQRTWWLNLETGELRWMLRSVQSLITWGWKVIEGDTKWQTIEGLGRV